MTRPVATICATAGAGTAEQTKRTEKAARNHLAALIALACRSLLRILAVFFPFGLRIEFAEVLRIHLLEIILELIGLE